MTASTGAAVSSRVATDFLELEVFVAVVEAGAFSEAARRLGLSPPSISRHISALEARLRAKLIQRNTRTILVTEAGSVFYAKIRPVLEDLQAAEAEASSSKVEARGHLKVSLSAGVALSFINPNLPEFLRAYPQLRVEIMLTAERRDMLKDGIDLAIASSNDVNINATPGFTAIFLARLKTGIYASPAYLAAHGTPVEPADLQYHNCLCGRTDTFNELWPMQSSEGIKPVRVRGSLIADSGDLLLEAVRNDIGIAMLPRHYVQAALVEGEVVSVLEGHLAQTHTLYAIVPDRAYLAKKVGVFVDFVRRCFNGATTLEMVDPGAGEDRPQHRDGERLKAAE
ncbi:LysR family transcriptional regulator [Sphingomonas profundi]|uniref:LysR family transcriptional regulator n=1 Tax=Alterirhizorhabdus profundi TaxID=2681549 RepID=UPI0018D031B6|nr:LysR family transcriptional regulator [Sphingomonas profundi]